MWGLHKKCHSLSENEVLYQKFMCAMYYKKRKKMTLNKVNYFSVLKKLPETNK